MYGWVDRWMGESSYGDRSFPVAAAKLWNALPLYIKSTDTKKSFKSSLKTFLFHSYNQ